MKRGTEVVDLTMFPRSYVTEVIQQNIYGSAVVTTLELKGEIKQGDERDVKPLQ